MSSQEDYCKPGDDLPFEMEDVACDLCGSVRQREVYRRRDRLHMEYAFRLVECLGCGLAFVNPRPTIESLGFFYPLDFYAEMSLPPQQRSYANRLNYLGKNTSQTVLDVGSGRGDFPLLLKNQGWKVEGHEVICTALIPEVTIHTIPLMEMAQTGKTYDMVCSWAVFEHLTRPSLYFQAVRDLLKPGGTFIFLVTNFESPASRHFMQEDIPRHLFVFSPKTCEAYLKKFGFQPERVYYKNDVFRLNHPHALRWLWSKITGRSFDDYSYIGYRNPGEANHYLEKIKILTYNYTNKIIDRTIQVVCRILRKNGIITIVAKRQ